MAAAVVLGATFAILPSAAPTAVAAAPARAGAPVPTPTLTTPPVGLKGFPLWDSYSDLADLGYEEQEYFVSGTAVDAQGGAAGYTTRIIVTRPIDAADFNGTVLLDWVNVTAQFENAVDSLEGRQLLLRDGYAVVHVSAQAAGLDGNPLTPKQWDPVRYAAISHPGDDFSFDMFSQVAQAFRSPASPGSLDPMGDLGVGSVEHVLGAGQSQSALRLRDYIDEWLPSHPSAVGLIDGALVHGDVGAAKPFDNPLSLKVLNLLSDLEAKDDGFDLAAADPSYRLWEVAGAGHSDYWIGHQSVAGHGPRVLTGAPKQDDAEYAATLLAAGNYGERVEPELLVCTVAGSAMPMHYAVSSAIHQLHRWVAGGEPPDNGPRFEFEGGALAKDADGNSKGGIRLPPIEVPVARYESTACELGGITVPFTDAQLAERYGTHAVYYDQMAKATDAAVAGGWILPPDAIDLMARACAAKVRFPDADRACPAYAPPAYDHPLARPVADAAGAAGPRAAAVPASTGALPATGGPASGTTSVALAGVALLLGLALRAARAPR
ncbi:MAG: alpha/beta hydrolase domain-containing protein [Acidimicrobiales bacterium]